MCEFLGFSLVLRVIVFCVFSTCFSLSFIDPAISEEEEADTDFALDGQETSDSLTATTNKKFKFFTKASSYLRYGGVRVSDATTLIGYSEKIGTLETNDFVLNNNYDSYENPLVSLGSFRFDPYELILGFDAGTRLISKMYGGVRVSFDSIELGEFFSGSDWGGRSVYPSQHFSSGPLREGFVYLSHPRWGKFSFGILEGVSSILDGGAQAISAGSGGLYGDFSRTPWQVHRLGLTLGRASSENFPKVQYLSPSFRGLDIGLEWFTNGQSAANKVFSLPYLSNSNCLPSLFYRNDQTLGSFFLNPDPDFNPDDFFPGTLPSSIKCWQLSSSSSGWHSNVSSFIMGGNLAISYEKSFSKNLSLEVATSYGILSSSAHSIESRDEIAGYYSDTTGRISSLSINKVSSLEQALSFGASLYWRDYSFFSGFVYLLPSEYELENLSGDIFIESGVSGLIWSMGIKLDRLIPTRGDDKVGGISLSYAQAIIKDPRLDDGEQQIASLLNIGSNYPLADGVLLVMDYWYGDASLILPFEVARHPSGEVDFTFHERRLRDAHEFAIGLKMEF